MKELNININSVSKSITQRKREYEHKLQMHDENKINVEICDENEIKLEIN